MIPSFLLFTLNMWPLIENIFTTLAEELAMNQSDGVLHSFNNQSDYQSINQTNTFRRRWLGFE